MSLEGALRAMPRIDFFTCSWRLLLKPVHGLQLIKTEPLIYMAVRMLFPNPPASLSGHCSAASL